jgi:hypothetical protein
MWAQRTIFFLMGVAFVPFIQFAWRQIQWIVSFRRTNNPSSMEKGFLDYKTEAEESARRIGPILVKIARIIERIGPTMQAHTLRIAAAASSPARVQIKIVQGVAASIDKFSKKLDIQAEQLERVGRSATEGLSGWLTWISKQNNKDKAAPLIVPLQNLLAQTTIAIESFDKYKEAVESHRGISRDLNAATDAHLRSLQRIRDVEDGIRKSCLESLRLLENQPN